MYCRQSLYGVVEYLQISVLHQVVKKRSSVRLRLTFFLLAATAQLLMLLSLDDKPLRF